METVICIYLLEFNHNPFRTHSRFWETCESIVNLAAITSSFSVVGSRQNLIVVPIDGVAD